MPFEFLVQRLTKGVIVDKKTKPSSFKAQLSKSGTSGRTRFERRLEKAHKQKIQDLRQRKMQKQDRGWEK